jgi:hypothetical protein
MYENIAIVMGNPKHPTIVESSMIVSRRFAANSKNVLWDWMSRQYSRWEDRDQMGRARNRLHTLCKMKNSSWPYESVNAARAS